MFDAIEQKVEFYDDEYFKRMRLRHISGAHSSRINNILSVIGDVKGKRILDIGCGDGWITNELTKRGADITGIDHSENAIAFAKKQYPHTTFQIGSIYNIKQFPEKSFDGVLLVDILGHVKDLKKTLNETKSILKPNGFIIASEDLYDSYWNKLPLSIFIRKPMIFSKSGRAYLAIKKYENQFPGAKNYHISQINDFSENQFKKLFADNGFKVITYKTYPLVSVLIRDLPLRLLPHRFHGDHQCIKATKQP